MANWLKKHFPTFKFRVRFLLKSGESIYVRCDDINIERSADGSLNSYHMSGVCRFEAFYINLNEIAAIQVAKNFENGEIVKAEVVD